MSIDGGGVKSIIPAILIDYIEEKTYEIAYSKGYIKANEFKKVPSYQLFDLIAGTSTGGILVSALSSYSANDTSRPYFASEFISIFETHGPTIFKRNTINGGLLGIMICTSVMIFGVLFYHWGKFIFASEKVEEVIHQLRNYVKELKKHTQMEL